MLGHESVALSRQGICSVGRLAELRLYVNRSVTHSEDGSGLHGGKQGPHEEVAQDQVLRRVLLLLGRGLRHGADCGVHPAADCLLAFTREVGSPVAALAVGAPRGRQTGSRLHEEGSRGVLGSRRGAFHRERGRLPPRRRRHNIPRTRLRRPNRDAPEVKLCDGHYSDLSIV